MFIVDDLILENYVPEYVDVTMPQTSGHYASYENLCSWILYIYIICRTVVYMHMHNCTYVYYVFSMYLYASTL